MKTIIVDDEETAIEHLEMTCQNIPEVELAGRFDCARTALDYLNGCKDRGTQIEFALLDIEMPDMNGIELAQRIWSLFPGIVIIFVTGHMQYVMDALKIKADYYIMKPYEEADILDAVERAQLLSRRLKKRIRAKMFGRFDLFVNEKAVPFTNAKAKELLALCIDHRGGNVTMEEAIDKLWEDREYDGRVKQRYRTTMMQLRSTLRQYGAEGLFDSVRGSCFIRQEMLDCDYYDFLDGKESAYEEFDEEYLFDYSWGEETLAALMRRKYGE